MELKSQTHFSMQALNDRMFRLLDSNICGYFVAVNAFHRTRRCSSKYARKFYACLEKCELCKRCVCGSLTLFSVSHPMKLFVITFHR